MIIIFIEDNNVSGPSNVEILYVEPRSDSIYICLAFGRDTLMALEKEQYDHVLHEYLNEIIANPTMRLDSLYMIKANNTSFYGSERGKDVYYTINAKYMSETILNDIPKSDIDEKESVFYNISNYIFELGQFSG